MCAPSVERGGGENGWADGLTGGAVCAGPEPPTKNIRRAAPRAGLGRFHCRARELKRAAIEPDVKWIGRFRHIANVRGGDGEAALAASEKKLYPKESALIDPVAAERMEGRRVLVYATHTGTGDITGRMDDIPTRHGFRVAVMRGGGLGAPGGVSGGQCEAGH